jgi:hypothetical protein
MFVISFYKQRIQQNATKRVKFFGVDIVNECDPPVPLLTRSKIPSPSVTEYRITISQTHDNSPIHFSILLIFSRYVLINKNIKRKRKIIENMIITINSEVKVRSY